MKAVQIHQYGGPEVLTYEDAPGPEPNDNELAAETAAEYGVRTEKVLVQPNQTQLAQLAKLVDAADIKPVIEAALPLKDAQEAHRRVEQGHTRGKIVLEVTR